MPSRTQNRKAQFEAQEARTSNRRGVDNREVRERFLIICEGAKTVRRRKDGAELL